MENKLIADKINSLDTLPQGYEPNLDSKWALLQSGSGKKNREAAFLVYARRIGIAACLLLCAAGIFRYVQYLNDQTLSAPLPVKSVYHEKPASTYNVKVNDFPVSAMVLSQLKPKIRNKIVKQPADKITVLAVNEITVVVKQDSIILNEVHEEQSLVAPPVKNKKQRYVQFDFDDHAMESNEKNIYAQTFHFRLSLKNSGYSNQSQQNDSPVKLKQTF